LLGDHQRLTVTMVGPRKITWIGIVLALALLGLGAASCGGGQVDSPDARSYEYLEEGWCYRWVPQGEANLDKARKLCKRQVAERGRYLRETLGKAQEKGPTAWNLEACLKVLGWERCPE
jgi:hypothetical protein